jgi:hypothetical protein
VRLPVSQRSKLPEEFGTRHHAAMGLSEKSDALAIAVSEERGKITLLNKGKFRPANDLEKLAATIVSHWNKTASLPWQLPEGRSRWLIFLQMLVSLALAVFFWSTLIISQSEILDKIVTVPVRYTASTPNLILIGDKQNDVRLYLSGPKSDLDSINPEQLSVRIDLSKTVAGEQIFPINAENIKLQGDVKLLDVIPSSVVLTLAEIEEREVFIKPQLIGKLPGGMKILSI